MKCSVVMTTYNGARYVRRQLDSLKAQTLPPDEVLIFDDGSTDGTVPLVRAYIRDNALPHWRLICNPQNLGWKQNFMQGLGQAAGEVLFPCDQDDIWRPEKLRQMCGILQQCPEIALLACDYTEQYEAGAVPSKHYRGRETRQAGAVVQGEFTRHFFMNPRPGCTYAVRRAFFDRVRGAWQSDFPHDEYLWLTALLCGGAYFYNVPLQTFCRHAGNSSDVRYKDIPMQKRQLDYIGRALEALLELSAAGALGAVSPERIFALRQAQRWQQKRMRLMETRNPLRWLALAPWWGYYNSPQNCLSDLWLVLLGKFMRG